MEIHLIGIILKKSKKSKTDVGIHLIGIQWIAAIVDLLQLKWISPYLRYPTSKMAEIWPPGIFFQYICTCKVSASYLLYLRSSINEII